MRRLVTVFLSVFVAITDALAPLLNEFTTAVQSARDAIMNSDRDRRGDRQDLRMWK